MLLEYVYFKALENKDISTLIDLRVQKKSVEFIDKWGKRSLPFAVLCGVASVAALTATIMTGGAALPILGVVASTLMSGASLLLRDFSQEEVVQCLKQNIDGEKFIEADYPLFLEQVVTTLPNGRPIYLPYFVAVTMGNLVNECIKKHLNPMETWAWMAQQERTTEKFFKELTPEALQVLMISAELAKTVDDRIIITMFGGNTTTARDAIMELTDGLASDGARAGWPTF